MAYSKKKKKTTTGTPPGEARRAAGKKRPGGSVGGMGSGLGGPWSGCSHGSKTCKFSGHKKWKTKRNFAGHKKWKKSNRRTRDAQSTSGKYRTVGKHTLYDIKPKDWIIPKKG